MTTSRIRKFAECLAVLVVGAACCFLLGCSHYHLPEVYAGRTWYEDSPDLDPAYRAQPSWTVGLTWSPK